MCYVKNITVITIMIIATVFGTASIANGDPLEYRKDRPLGDVVKIEQAVSDFENDLQKDIELPKFIPFEVTYSGAKYSSIDKSILITYLNEKTGALMDVHVKKGNIPDKLTSRQKLIKMNIENGVSIFDSEEKRGVNFIYFYKQGLEYRVALTKRPVEYKQETFIKVVESFS